MAKTPMSNAQKYRRANARGAGPGAEGRAKIATAEMIAKDPKKYDKAGEGTVYGLRAEGSRLLGQDYARKIGGEGEVGMYNKGGMIKEGSAKDMREDKAMAKKAGMTMKQHEASAADKKHDAPKKMAMGGKIKMVEKGGKKVPSFAADGVGKMAMGGAVKKMNYGGGMKTGGTVRGAGAAIRGKRFTGSC